MRRADRKLIVGFGLVLGAVIALAVVAWRGRSASFVASAAVGHTREVIGEISAVRAAVQSSESNERGYIITGDQTYLAIHEQAAATIDQHLDRLATLVRDNPEQTRRLASLRTLVVARRESLSHGAGLRSQQGFEAAQRWVIQGQGHRIMADLLASMSDMTAEEERLLGERNAGVEATGRRDRVLFALLVGAAAVFLVGAAAINRREIDRRQRAQAEAQQQATTLQLVLDSVGEGISVADASGSVLSLNRAGERMMGRRASSSGREAWPREFGVFHLDGKPLAIEDSTIMRALRGESTDDVEWLVKNESQEGLVISVSGRPIRDPGGRITGAVSVFRDVSLRKRHEEALQRAMEQTAAANRELEAFSYSVAHDLRAPLRAIDGFSQALLEDYAGKLDQQGRDFLGRVRAAAQRMAALIDDLLALSRLSRSEMKLERVDLSKLGKEVAAELSRRDPKREVDVRVADGLTVRADPRLLRVALDNLLGNAWKFTSQRPSAHIELGAHNGHFFVRDDGVGFDMAHAEKLFGAFQRLHAEREFEGTGIGLATVARIVHRHGGQVWAEGQPGKGATFFFTLPTGKTPS